MRVKIRYEYPRQEAVPSPEKLEAIGKNVDMPSIPEVRASKDKEGMRRSHAQYLTQGRDSMTEGKYAEAFACALNAHAIAFTYDKMMSAKGVELIGAKKLRREALDVLKKVYGDDVDIKKPHLLVGEDEGVAGQDIEIANMTAEQILSLSAQGKSFKIGHVISVGVYRGSGEEVVPLTVNIYSWTNGEGKEELAPFESLSIAHDATHSKSRVGTASSAVSRD